MNSTAISLGVLAAGAASLALATPVIPENSVSISQNAGHVVTVTYTLGDGANLEPAIVTVDFETNVTGTAEGPWASIGERNFRNVQGWVNKVVEPGTHTITWRPNRVWPDHVIAAGNFRARVKAWAKTCPPDYLAIDLVTPMRFYYTSTNALPFDIGDDICRSDVLLMRKIPAANVEWRMGSPSNENGREIPNASKQAKYPGYETTHYVTLTKDYYFGVFPITRGQYAHVMSATAGDLPCKVKTGLSYNFVRYGNDNGTAPGGGTWPAEKAVTTSSFMYKLRQLAGIDTFDLPTSAQWEFACRAGTMTALYNGKELTPQEDYTKTSDVVDPNVDDLAWYIGNSGGACPDRVGMKQPNGWGLYDLYGTVYEWCLDFARKTWLETEVDPEGPESGTERFQVGGVNNDNPARCRSAFRMNRTPNTAYSQYEIFGIRVQCDAVAP